MSKMLYPHNYRATIVSDGSENEDPIWEAVRWIKDYAEVNGVQDLKDSIETIEKKLRNIL